MYQKFLIWFTHKKINGIIDHRFLVVRGRFWATEWTLNAHLYGRICGRHTKIFIILQRFVKICQRFLNEHPKCSFCRSQMGEKFIPIWSILRIYQRFYQIFGRFWQNKKYFFNHSSIFTFNLPSIIHKSSADVQNLQTTIPLLTSFYAWYPVLICVLFKSVINEICSNILFL